MSFGGSGSREPFPVHTRIAVTPKSGVHIVLHSYSNSYFVVVSEAGSQSVGSIIEVIKHQQANGFDVGPASAVYDIHIRFGSETPDLLLAARILASKVNFNKPVVFGLALKKFDKNLCEEISEELTKIVQSLP